MAIYRGTGGSAEATNNATVNEVAGYATDAETSATNAASSATSAASSATSASSSATASASSATASESSATASATSASASATSATNASTSASQAASSASAASTSASNALTSETNAASSETAAASSATSAATSATSAATSASNASTSETNAATSASNASTSETNAATSASEAAASAASIVSDELESAANAAAAAQSYDNFDDRYLGAKASDPTVDNDGDALITGAMYFDSSNNVMKVYSGTEWQNASSSIEGIKSDFVYTATASQTVFSGADDNTNTLVIDKAGLVNVYLNGVRLTDADYTIDAPGNSVTLGSGATVGDIVEIEVFGNFAGQSGADVAITGGVIDGVAIGSNTASTGAFTTVTTTGDVGIGTDSPDSPSGFSRTAEISDSLSASFVASASGSDLELGVSSSGGWIGTSGVSTNKNVRFVTSGAERARIDSSGNLLVGTTIVNASGTNVAGVTAQADGRLDVSSAVEPLDINRISTDGTIVNFRKDGSTVGSIGTKTGTNRYLTIGGSTGTPTGLIFDTATASIGAWNVSTNSGAGDTIDLGYASRRFKDLYLSGGVYLGGTGSANKLDSYEEGTWTPTAIGLTSAGVATYNIYRNGYYTKVGNMVHAHGIVGWGAHTGSGALAIVGLPFPTSNSTYNYTAVTIGEYNGLTLGVNNYLTGTMSGNSSTIALQRVDTSSGASTVAQVYLDTAVSYIVFSVTYKTDS